MGHKEYIVPLLYTRKQLLFWKLILEIIKFYLGLERDYKNKEICHDLYHELRSYWFDLVSSVLDKDANDGLKDCFEPTFQVGKHSSLENEHLNIALYQDTDIGSH